jgi:hypothetical protein
MPASTTAAPPPGLIAAPALGLTHEQARDLQACIQQGIEQSGDWREALDVAAGLAAMVVAATDRSAPAPYALPDAVPGRSNIADSPAAIAAFFTRPASARTEYGQRVGAIHLRELSDGYWTRLMLVTERHGRGEAKEFLTTLVFDHHREHDTGEQTRTVPGATAPILSAPAAGRISPAALEAHHAEAAALLVAYPEAIAYLLARHAGDSYRGPIR